MAEYWTLGTQIEDTERNRKLIEAAIKHDWLLFEKKGMNRLTLSSWITFIINKRLNEIRDGR